jgi:hypothetical protein
MGGGNKVDRENIARRGMVWMKVRCNTRGRKREEGQIM